MRATFVQLEALSLDQFFQKSTMQSNQQQVVRLFVCGGDSPWLGFCKPSKTASGNHEGDEVRSCAKHQASSVH